LHRSSSISKKQFVNLFHAENAEMRRKQRKETATPATLFSLRETFLTNSETLRGCLDLLENIFMLRFGPHPSEGVLRTDPSPSGEGESPSPEGEGFRMRIKVKVKFLSQIQTAS
jgi:hypothetical protein